MEGRPAEDEVDGRGEDAPASDAVAAVPERGRDLLYLALALVMANEAVFTFFVIAQDSAALTAQLGRFALKAGLAYMTGQGFSIPRWVLVVLVAAAIVAGPFALADAWRSGDMGFTAILTATFLAYVAAGWLLVFSRDVSDFIRHRRFRRQQEWLTPGG
jgi:uncharacterized membrane protein HdeD (DUF308 family)